MSKVLVLLQKDSECMYYALRNLLYGENDNVFLQIKLCCVVSFR